MTRPPFGLKVQFPSVAPHAIPLAYWVEGKLWAAGRWLDRWAPWRLRAALEDARLETGRQRSRAFEAERQRDALRRAGGIRIDIVDERRHHTGRF